MSKLRIFIEGQELDTLDSVKVPITRQFEELDDPTVICNDYSKTVTVPLTAHNNDIFGHAYRTDRAIVAGSDDTPLVGVYFDPYKKLQCRLQWGSDVIMTGYAKMLKVTQEGYEVTINGELGRVFQEMQKITFDGTKYSGAEHTKYWINGAKYVDVEVNKDLVAANWKKAPSALSGDLHEVGDADYDVHSVIGFTPNNAFTDGFDYKSYGVDEEHTFADLLIASGFEDSGITADTAIGDGLHPREEGEFRAINQIPHIYWVQFCKIFAAKVQSVTGYTLDVSNVCNSLNHLAMRLKTPSQSVSELKENIYTFDTVSNNYAGLTGFSTKKTGALQLGIVSEQWSGICNTTSNVLQLGTRVGLMKCTVPITIGVRGPSKTPVAIAKGDYLLVSIIVNGNEYHNFYIVSSDSTVSVPSAWNNYKVVMDNFSGSSADGWWSYPELTFYTKVSNTTAAFRYSIHYYADDYPWRDSNPAVTYYTYTHIAKASAGNLTVQVAGDMALHQVTLNDLWDNDVQPFDVLLNYCKVHRLRFVVDETTKTISIKPFASQVSEFSTKDMTDRVDMSKGFDVEPVAFTSHFIRFNTSNADTTNASEYATEYGLKYGEKRLTTQYNFDTSEKTLFDDYRTDILYTPYVNSLPVMMSKKRVLYILPSEIYVDAQKENKYADNFGTFYYITRGRFDTDDNLTDVAVTDASYAQEYNNKYFYLRISDSGRYSEQVAYYLKPNHFYSKELEMLGVPAKNYTYLSTYFSGMKDLYTRKWQNYISERYNVQNKVVTCYVRLSASEFMAFDFKQLWKIGGVCYMVNKIYDYDITSDEPVKVQLVTIQDINGYI